VNKQDMAGGETNHGAKPRKVLLFLFITFLRCIDSYTIDTTLITIHPFDAFLSLSINAILKNNH